jgi:uncharacterized protein (TIGR02453 family)
VTLVVRQGFRGFPDDAFAFYEALGADNSRAFWQANRDRYVASVRAPMEALLTELDQACGAGPFHVFRPYRDVRFAKDKTPYKDHIGAYGESEAGAGFYVQLSAAGMFAGSGYYHFAADQLTRFRDAVDAEAMGSELAAIVAALEAAGVELAAVDELRTAPRGYARDHPRVALLRRKGLAASRTWRRAGWMGTREVVARVQRAWEETAPLNAWLDAHVGPSTLPPDDRP